MRKSILFLLVILFQSTHAQDKKSIQAAFINSPLTIDGILSEPVYSNAVAAKDFIQLNPYNGKPSMQPAEAYFFYDQTAIYVGATLFDSAPDSIYNFLSERDVIGSADYFGVYLDPYNQGQLAYGFFVTAAGVQLDLKAIKSDFDYEDVAWDAVWTSKARIAENGWVVEMKIPYSALRFPENGNGIWGLNMFRNIRRYNSNNSWNRIDKEVSGFIHQQGTLTGISNIKAPMRLSLTPYTAVYSEFREEKSSPDWVYKGGLDLKYGISESFTLDMMLIPDFGQIQPDDKQLNLSPYELYYSERRQFFTEGTELFNRAGIFYSRRIGATPKFRDKADEDLQAHEIISNSPSETQLLNATKISGRTLKGNGMGFLNAMTLPSYATIRDTISGNKRKVRIQPFTNYNVVVFDKSLKNNSYFSLINSNVAMTDDPFAANVTATDFQIRNKAKNFVFKGKGGLSYRNDAGKETGYFGELNAAKNSGKFQYGVTQSVLSDEYNPNDLGYLMRNNEYRLTINAQYHINEPFGIFREWHFTGWGTHNRVYRQFKPAGNELGFNTYSTFKNNHGAQMHLHYYGSGDNYYEPRTEGRFYREPQRAGICLFYWTNDVKPVSILTGFSHFTYPNSDQSSNWGTTNFRFRLGRRFQFYYQAEYSHNINSRGFGGTNDPADSIFFTRRNVKTVNNVISTSYMLSNKANFNVRFRHYWSGVVNKKSYLLREDGRLSELADYPLFENENYNSINIDLNFRWIFSPGSELSVAWKNSIFDWQEEMTPNYWENLESTWKSSQTNSFSVRLLYYLDYNMLRRKG